MTRKKIIFDWQSNDSKIMKNDEKYINLSYKQRVTGSNPVAPTPIKKGLSGNWEAFLFYFGLNMV